MFSKVDQIISTADFTLIDRFQNSPKVNNLFESEFVAKNFQKLPNQVTLLSTISRGQQKASTKLEEQTRSVCPFVLPTCRVSGRL